MTKKKGHGLNLQVKNAIEIGLKSKCMLLIKDTLQLINGTIQKRALLWEERKASKVRRVDSRETVLTDQS